MAVASYSTDLVTVNDGQSGSWLELTGAAAGSSPTEVDTDNFIRGINSTTEAVRNSGDVSIVSPSSTTTVVSGDAVFIWGFFGGIPVLDTKANEGFCCAIGNALTDYNKYKVFGKDTLPKGGWKNYAVDPLDPASTAVAYGTPTAILTYFGVKATMLDGIAKGNAFATDIIRKGRSLIVVSGDANAYGTFEEAARYNDANDISFLADTINTDATLTNIVSTAGLYPGAPLSGTGIPASTFVSYVISSTSVEMTNAATATNTAEAITSQPYLKLGLFEKIDGGYSQKGLFQIGSASTAADFRDSNKNIVTEDTEHCNASFNEIEIVNASTNVEWTGIQFSSLGSQSPGLFTMTNNATVTKVGCTFNDRGTFIYQSNASIDSGIYRRCGQITTGGAPFDGCKFESSPAATSVLTSSPSNAAIITNSKFTSDGNGNGLEIGGTAANITLSGLDFSGYSTTVDADKAIFVNIATGSMTINISGGTGVTADSHVRTAGCTVTVSADVSVTFDKMKDDTEVRVYNNATGVEIDGIEDVTAGSTDDRSFTWASPATTVVDYVIHHWSGTAPFYQTIRVNGYVVPATNTTIDINQLINRNAS